MASGSSADTATTFVGGEVAAPAAREPTADDPRPSRWIQQLQKKRRNRNLRRHLQVVARGQEQVRLQRLCRKRDQRQQVQEPKQAKDVRVRR